MTSPLTRALSLTEHLCDLACEGSERNVEAYEVADDLRSAIQAIEASPWQPLTTAPIGTWVRLLVEDENGRRSVLDCSLDAQGWWIAGEGYLMLETNLRPLAWHPADSTELPADWGTKV